MGVLLKLKTDMQELTIIKEVQKLQLDGPLKQDKSGKESITKDPPTL